MITRTRTLPLAAGFILATAIPLGAAAPAHAEEAAARPCSLEAYHGNDLGRGDNCNGGWARITVWDREADGHGVRVEYYINRDGTMRTVGDANGSAGDGGYRSHTNASVTRFRVCEETQGCSTWRYPTQE